MKVCMKIKPTRFIIGLKKIPSLANQKEKARQIRDGDDVTLNTDKIYRIPDYFILERFVEMLDSNPRTLSERFINMGREDLAGIIHLPKNFTLPRTNLKDMLEWYFDYEERSTDTKKKVRLLAR